MCSPSFLNAEEPSMTRYMPLRAGTFRLSSPFGPRGGGMHWGTDFAAPDGTPMYAAQAGTVVYIGRAQGFGQWIVIDHPTEAGSGTTVYGHMWNAFATGLEHREKVAAGQHIAYVGNNGDSSGAHLHFEVHPTVWRPGSQLDPMPWLAGAHDPAGPRPDGEAREEISPDREMLIGIYELLTTPVPSRSAYRDNNQPVDMWRGMLQNIDGMAHEAYIERDALLGHAPAVAIVRRCAESSDDPKARERAAFILSKVPEPREADLAGEGEVNAGVRRAAKAPAKKVTKASLRARRNP
jgi:hypothetical protein